jgi:hypothetical protein
MGNHFNYEGIADRSSGREITISYPILPIHSCAVGWRLQLRAEPSERYIAIP